MKRLFSFILVLCFVAPWLRAERIDEATARKVAVAVASQQSAGGSGLRSANDLSLIYTAAKGQEGVAFRSGEPVRDVDYFVYNFSNNKGFAIVAGDDRVRPVLGYADQGYFDPNDVPDGLRWMLARYQKEIKWTEEHQVEASADIESEWYRYLSGNGLRAATKEVVLNTALWGQSEPFCNLTPMVKNEKGEMVHTPTGCVATATAIIMKYYEHPNRILGQGVSSYWGQEVTYQDYNWNNMPDLYRDPVTHLPNYTKEQGDAVAALMWNIGANIDMEYALDGSGALTQTSTSQLVNLFGYDADARIVYKREYRHADWKRLIYKEIDANRPILYSGYIYKDGVFGAGHAFVLSGYKGDDLFYFNWGWTGNSNGFFVLNAADKGDKVMEFNEGMEMALGLFPEDHRAEPCKELRFMNLSSSSSFIEVNKPFVVRMDVVGENNTPYNALLGVAVVDNAGEIKKIINDKPLSCEFGFDEKFRSGWSYTDLTLKCKLPAALEKGEKMLPVYSADKGRSWLIMEGGEAAPLYLNQHGAIYENDDPEKPQERPSSVYVNKYTTYDWRLIPISSLDNSVDNNNNIQSLDFIARNLKPGESLRFRFKIRSFDRWKNHFAVYNNEEIGDQSFGLAGKGTRLDFKQGAFEVDVPFEQLNNGQDRLELKLFADLCGEVFFDMEVLSSADHYQKVLAELKEKKWVFVKMLMEEFTPRPVVGKVNELIPFTYTISNVDAMAQGKTHEIQLLINRGKEMSIQPGDLNVFVEQNGKDIALPLSVWQNDARFLISERVSMGTVEKGRTYTFKMGASRPIERGDGCYMFLWNFFTDYSGDWPMTYFLPEEQSQSPGIEIEDNVAERYGVSFQLTGLNVRSGNTLVNKGWGCSAQLASRPNYTLPRSIEVQMSGRTLIDGSDYTYDMQDGHIWIKRVMGDVKIIAKGDLVKEVISYGVRADLSDLQVKEGLPESIEEGENLVFTLVPENDKMLPNEIEVKMNGKVLTCGPGLGYSYDIKTGKVLIYNVFGDVVIHASAVKEQIVYYRLEARLNHLTSALPEEGIQVKKGASASVVLKADEGYRLPNKIKLWKLAETNTPFNDFTYDKSTGKVVINHMIGNIGIEAGGIDDRHYEVILNLKGLRTEPKTVPPVLINTKPEFTLVALKGFALPDKIEVKMGMRTLVAGDDYVYSKMSGTVKMLRGVTGPLTITATGVGSAPDPDPVKYKVTLPVVEGAVISASGSTEVEAGASFSFSVTILEGYRGTNMVVTANGTVLEANAAGLYVIPKVTDNVVIHVTGIEKIPVSIESVEDASVKVWGERNRLHIRTTEQKRVQVVAFDGRVLDTFMVREGETVKRMESGVYMIRVDERTFKIQF